ncbi:cutinase family protein [Rhodococcus sp. NPDC054953]
MTLRGYFARHRLISMVAAPAALGVAGAATAWVAYAPPATIDTELTASTTECHDMVTVSIAGRNDTPPDTVPRLVDENGKPLPAALSDDYSSHWVDPVANAPGVVNTLKPGSYANLYIAYPANMDSYEQAVTTGVDNTQQVMRKIREACPNTRFSVVGYSEGADVARRVAQNIGHQDGTDGYAIVDPANVVGVVILADAGRALGQGPFPGAKNPFRNPDGFDTPYQTGENTAGGAGAVTGIGGDDFGALGGKIAAFCSDGDLTCAVPENISLLQLVVNVGRQMNIDSLEKDGLTADNGIGVAMVLGRIASDAFAVIQSTPGWMQSDQTFMDVLLEVSDPAYDPTAVGTAALPVTPVADSIETESMSPLAYLPRKFFNEVVNLIVTNQNTIPVVLSDPYQLTLGPDTGHHFDYWRDTADGKPLSSAEYAAQWLTRLAEDARDGIPLPTTTTVAPTTTTSTTSTTGTSTTTTTADPTTRPGTEPPVDPGTEPPVDPDANADADARMLAEPGAAAPAPAPAPVDTRSPAVTTDVAEPTTPVQDPPSSTVAPTTTAAPTSTAAPSSSAGSAPGAA